MLGDLKEQRTVDEEAVSTESDHDCDEDEETIVIEEATMHSIVKFQALVRGYLTRKLIYEHLQQLVQQSQYEQEGDSEESMEQEPARVSDPN